MCWRLMLIILATQETEIKRITVRSQPGQIVCETLSRKKPFTHTKKKELVGVDQGVGPEFKPRYCKKKKEDRVLETGWGVT
jgi:hypothetical protein